MITKYDLVSQVQDLFLDVPFYLQDEYLSYLVESFGKKVYTEAQVEYLLNQSYDSGFDDGKAAEILEKP